MRGGKSLLALLALALGLGGYIYFVEMKKDPDAATKKDKVFAVETGKIEALEVHAASGDVTKLEKKGTDWQIVAPVAVAADQSAAGALVSTLETLERQKTLDENPGSVAQYGLDPVKAYVSFKVAGDATPHRINLGSKTPTGSDLYARVEGQPRLFVISAYLEDSLNRSTFDLRDKTVLKFTRDTVDAVSLEKPGAPAMTLTRKDVDWRITAPVTAHADYSTVDSLISRVSSSQMKAIVAGDAAPPSDKDLKTYGLDKPQLVLTLGAGSTRASLALGGKKDDTTVYARDMSKPDVFTVESSLLTDLDKKADDLRLKDLFQFKSYSAVGLDVTRGGTAYTFTKTKAQAPPPPAAGAAPATPATPPADTWKETKPAAKDVNQTAMTDLLNSLSTLRADKFADKPLATGEEVTVVARYGDATPPVEERVTFRKSGDVVHAIRANESGAAIVPTADYDKALTQLKDLADAK